jgi:hypothetical protein
MISACGVLYGLFTYKYFYMYLYDNSINARHSHINSQSAPNEATTHPKSTILRLVWVHTGGVSGIATMRRFPDTFSLLRENPNGPERSAGRKNFHTERFALPAGRWDEKDTALTELASSQVYCSKSAATPFWG